MTSLESGAVGKVDQRIVQLEENKPSVERRIDALEKEYALMKTQRGMALIFATFVVIAAAVALAGWQRLLKLEQKLAVRRSSCNLNSSHSSHSSADIAVVSQSDVTHSEYSP
jgi:hypothetical protein